MTWALPKSPGKNIIQLYKGKGPKDDFNNMRNIHTKLEIPKLFENMLLLRARPKIIEGTSKYQIGAMPGHRSSEDLFTLKSVIALYGLMGKALIMNLFDISKFFDRENLKDALGSLYKCGIVGKLYQLIFELNKCTEIRVKSASGLSDSKYIGENVTQGSVLGGLISANNLDTGIMEQFEGSEKEVGYGPILLKPLLFQDDISRLSTSRDAAQFGNDKVEACLESKLLDPNLDKSVFVIIGPKSCTKKIREDIKKNPLTLNGTIMKEKTSDKYLGDQIHQKGLKESVAATIKSREGKINAAIIEEHSIIDDCRVHTVGGSLAGLEIWELALIPSILNNCETWI